MCVLVGVCRGSMYNKGNGLSWARARGHGCLPSVCLCYVPQVQKFVSISKYRVQFFALISVQSTVFCFDLWTKYSTLDFCAGVVLCTLLWCVFIRLTIWWTLNPAFCFPQAPLWGALTILFDPCFQDEGLIFATDFHPILARGRPVDPQSTPNMGQMRSRWGGDGHTYSSGFGNSTNPRNSYKSICEFQFWWRH